jgi:hypothetical protein
MRIGRRAAVAWRQQQLQADPGQVGRAQVLHHLEHRRVRGQQRSHAGHRQPQQHLVADDHAERGGGAGAEAALAGGGEQREGAGAGQGQEQQDGGAEGAEVGDAEAWEPRHADRGSGGWRRCSLGWVTP